LAADSLILEEMYDNKVKGWTTDVLMFKILILQQLFGFCGLQVERQMPDRISLMSFLGFPNPFSDL
jgi:hypothetical protein